jgi:hypothetical protein
MAKILTDTELLEILRQIMSGNLIESKDSYLNFLDDISEIVGKYLGARAGTAGYTEDGGLGCTVAFYLTEETPPDGGIFSLYDKDVAWENGKEYDTGLSPSGLKEQLEYLKAVVANPDRYPDLFHDEIKSWFEGDSEVRIFSKYYDALDAVRILDPDRYKSLIEGFFSDVFYPDNSNVIENIREQIEEVEYLLKKQA